MIRTEHEYRQSLGRLQEARDAVERQRMILEQSGMSPGALGIVLEPMQGFVSQIEDEIDWYERAGRGEVLPVGAVTHIGRLLIGLRIACHLTQRQLAERLGVAESQVSRDERNEYYGATLERAQRVLDVLLAERDATFIAAVAPANPQQAGSAAAASAP